MSSEKVLSVRLFSCQDPTGGVNASRFAEDLVGTDPAPPDASRAVDLDPLERGATVRTGEPGHFPDAGRTHNSLDPEAPRPSW